MRVVGYRDHRGENAGVNYCPPSLGTEKFPKDIPGVFSRLLLRLQTMFTSVRQPYTGEDPLSSRLWSFSLHVACKR